MKQGTFLPMKHYKNFIPLILTLLALMLFTACDTKTSEDTKAANPPVVTVDTTPPVITLNGKGHITLEQNAVYMESGATAKDVVDGNVPVSIRGTVDTGTIGNYTVTYEAQDSAGNKANINRSVEVVNAIPTLGSITLECNASTVNIGDTVQLFMMGTYSDGSSKAVDENVTYTVTPAENVEVNGSVILAKKDGNTTVRATMDGVNSNRLILNIIWVVNGHVLPPEPDPVDNNATLLGIDINDNDVRDDVERWIYKEYEDKHPVYIDIAMQGAREKQKMLSHPEKAKEIHEKMVAPIDCESYYRSCIDKPLLNERINGSNFRKVIFNTKERMDAYDSYDTLLSGDSYTIPWCSERKQKCDFNTTKYDKK